MKEGLSALFFCLFIAGIVWLLQSAIEFFIISQTKGGIMFTKKDNKKQPFIGEILIVHSCDKYGSNHAPHVPSFKGYTAWHKFTASDCTGGHEEYVCIHGIFFKKQDVLYYEQEAFKDFKSNVEKRYKKPDLCSSLSDVTDNVNKMSMQINIIRAFERIEELEKKVAALEKIPVKKAKKP